MTADRWAETPMFILRRDCIGYATRDWQPGRFLEMGAGTGRLTAGFLERGFTGTCYDLGSESRALLRSNLATFGASVQVVDTLDAVAVGSFDYVFAFEVLEHIDSDVDALRAWIRFLKPGGRLLISVPAHMRKFGDEDRAVGHHRRYEKAQLERMLVAVGCGAPRVLSYGFPLAILTRHGNQLLTRLKGNSNEPSGADKEALSIRSGVERSGASLRLARVVNRRTLSPFVVLQRVFFETDWGDGYVAQAVRSKPMSRDVSAG
jgi:SAM-dependent methyltransferase